MSEPFIAEIRIFAGNFAPRGWAFCNGQLLPIAQNTALFSIIGTTYGGDGRTTTGLPNLQGRMPMHPGRGPGLTSRRLGQRGGVTEVPLSEAQMPAHSHDIQIAAVPGNDNDPTADGYWATSVGANSYAAPNNLSEMAPEALEAAGGSQSHTNRQPYLALSFIIALVGLYPSRS
jgi:microcystin-dependent protein